MHNTLLINEFHPEFPSRFAFLGSETPAVNFQIENSVKRLPGVGRRQTDTIYKAMSIWLTCWLSTTEKWNTSACYSVQLSVVRDGSDRRQSANRIFSMVFCVLSLSSSSSMGVIRDIVFMTDHFGDRCCYFQFGRSGGPPRTNEAP